MRFVRSDFSDAPEVPLILRLLSYPFQKLFYEERVELVLQSFSEPDKTGRRQTREVSFVRSPVRNVCVNFNEIREAIKVGTEPPAPKMSQRRLRMGSAVWDSELRDDTLIEKRDRYRPPWTAIMDMISAMIQSEQYKNSYQETFDFIDAMYDNNLDEESIKLLILWFAL